MPRLTFSTVLRVGVLMAAMVLPVAVPGASRGASTFVVNTTDDLSDTSPGDGLCSTSLATCSLRAAIEEANALPGKDVANFNIGGGGVQTITTASELPVITDPLTIDGSSQPGYAGMPLVVLDGTFSAIGLHVTAGGSTIRAIVVQKADIGIKFSGEDGNTLVGSYIGTDETGTIAAGNGVRGVELSGSSNNTIGNNLISGNGWGIILLGTSTSNTIKGNLIGTNAAGNAALGNAYNGIGLQSTATGNTIGGTTQAERNVISGNGGHGIDAGVLSVIQGNFIGTDVTGSYAIANASGIVALALAQIGGDTPGAGNVISGNIEQGIYGGFYSTVVMGNRIGVGANGLTPIPNGTDGVEFINQSTAITIGGNTPNSVNIIAYNGRHGVNLRSHDSIVTGNLIHHNSSVGIHVATDVRNSIRANSIYANGGLGIDLINNGNFELPAPVQTSPGAGTACAGCTIDVYGDAADEGQYYAGSTTADMAGNWSYPGPVLGAYVTATATDADGNTSEFSNAVLNPDSDGDGCSDAEELGANAALGGGRNPAGYWDFFNVTGDKTIDLSDALDILGYFGDPGTSAAANKRDRDNAGATQPWQTYEANDGVDLTDVLVNLQSFGHDCSAAP